jgi:molecular chaperone GrpE
VTKPVTKADLEQQVKELEAARDSAIADLQRVAADFDNFRKRTARDHQALVARAAEQLVKELLPVLDDLERALEAAHQHEEAKLEEGVRLVHRELSHVLAKEGLVAVETDGQFDPHEHEALLTQPSDAEEGAIVQVIQKGYRLGDRVLRPARVVVSSGAATPPVRDGGPGEGARGNREVPPASDEASGGDADD